MAPPALHLRVAQALKQALPTLTRLGLSHVHEIKAMVRILPHDSDVMVVSMAGADDKLVASDDEPVTLDDEPVAADDEPVTLDDEPVTLDDEPVIADDEPAETLEVDPYVERLDTIDSVPAFSTSHEAEGWSGASTRSAVEGKSQK